MRRAATAVLLLALIAIGAFVYHGSTASQATRAPKAASPRHDAESELVENRAPELQLDTGPAPADSRRVVPDAPATSPAASSSPACAVFGRVVDENNEGLAGVSVGLAAYKVWTRGVDVPRLPGKYDLHGWKIRSGADGSFRVVTPVPTAESVSLSIEPDPFHDSAWRFLGGSDPDARAPLHAGDNDLGVFRLVATGAIRGTVKDEAGRPLEDANLRIAEDRSTTLEREGVSDAGGSYLIAHVKPGSYGVNVECEGYLSEFRKPYRVERDRVTDGVDFVLRVAPTLSGVVVDQQGRALAGAKLWGWPSSSGQGAGGKSGADGSFTIHLPQDEPYTLEVELTGFDTFGLDDRSTHYTPGTNDLRIVLKRSADALTRFVVVDAVSGASIERFGLEIERDRGSKAARNGWTDYRANPQPGNHPGGELEMSARPGLDRYTVIAPGYVRKSGEVQGDSEDSSRQVLELDRGGTLTGRVISAGASVAGTAVRLEAGRMKKPMNPAPDSRANDGFEPDGVTTLATSADAEGRFRFEALDPGTYRLVARSAQGESVERTPVHIGQHGDQDLGDLVLLPGATILGQVLVPRGRSAAGLVVYLDDWRADVTQSTDAQGRFRFEDLSDGNHSLTVREVPGALAGGAFEHVALVAGETREVVIDARDRGTCNVALTIELTGRQVDWIEVVLRPIADPKQRIEVGRTDAKGRVAGWAPAAGDARIEIVAADRRTLLHPTAIVPLQLDQDVDMTVRFDVGSLAIELPSSVRWPDGGSATLELVRSDNAEKTTIQFGKDAQSRLTSVESGRRLHCDLVMAGEYEAVLSLYTAAAEQKRIPEGFGFRVEWRPAYQTNLSLLVRAGETTETQLP